MKNANVEMMETTNQLVEANLDTGSEVTIYDLSEDCSVEDSHGKTVLGKALLVGGVAATAILAKKVVVPAAKRGYGWAKTKIENIRNRKKSEEVIDVEAEVVKE